MLTGDDYLGTISSGRQALECTVGSFSGSAGLEESYICFQQTWQFSFLRGKIDLLSTFAAFALNLEGQKSI